MTKTEFNRCFDIAKSEADLSQFDMEILHGCGLPSFQKVSVVPQVAARLLRWQCFCLTGGIDNEELNNMRNIFRRKVELIG